MTISAFELLNQLQNNHYLCSVKKVLIIQTAFLGDVILATPVISEILSIYPGCTVDILVRKGNESLLENFPSLGTVLILNKKEGKYKSLRRLFKTIRQNRYDEVINLHRFASTGFLTAFSGASSRIGFDKNPLSVFYTKRIKHSIDGQQHEVERNLACIAHHGAASYRRPELFPSTSDISKISDLTITPFYCFAPASVWFTKRLPINKWVEMGKTLSQNGNVYLIGAPSDHELCESIKNDIGSEHCKNIAGQLSLLQSAALMSKAKRNYVNDSGPLHISSAMNAPVTAFFCSTIPGFGFGPLSDDAEIKETRENLDCRPCGIHGYSSCPKGHFKCATTIIMDVKH